MRTPINNGYLPEYVRPYKDRHGKERLRYRRKGFPTYHFKAPLGTEEFRIELAAARAGKPVAVERAAPGTISDLIARYYLSSAFRGGAMTIRKNRGILEAFRRDHGHRKVASATHEALDRLIAAKAQTHPAAARNLRKQLRRLFEYAVRIKMRRDNPVDGIHLPVQKAAPGEERGHRTWSEADIAAFQGRHPLGTKPRLAMELMLWTGCRRSDVVALGRQHVRNGRIVFTQQKTGKTMSIMIAPQLKAALDALPSINMTFLVTEYGKPFTANGFGGWFRERCNEAGLRHCSAHGLRKAISRRLAECGAGNQGIKSVTGHDSDSEVSRYTRAVEQGALADVMIADLTRYVMANLAEGSPLLNSLPLEKGQK